MTSAAHAPGHGWGRLLVAFLCGAAALGALIALVGLSIVGFGLYDPTATTPHGPIASWAVHTTFIRGTQRAARSTPTPSRFTAAQVGAGMKVYVARCELCHGGPATPRAAWVSAIDPTPPFLLDSARRWSPAELNLIIADGVKMTAMPAWRFTLDDGEIWDLVAFLESLPTTSPAHYGQARAALTAPAPGDGR